MANCRYEPSGIISRDGNFATALRSKNLTGCSGKFNDLEANTVLINDTLRANQFLDKYNVKYYGAVGDGVTDDTAAIQLAMDTNTVVYFPNGTFLVSAALLYNPGQKIIGQSWNSRILLAAGANPSNLFTAKTTGAYGSNGSVQVQNLALDGNVANAASITTTGLRLTNVFNAIVSNVYITRFSNGIVCSSDVAYISDSYIYRNRNYGVILGVDMHISFCDVGANGVAQCELQNSADASDCVFWGGGGFGTVAGVVISGTNNTLKGCLIEGNSGHGVLLSGTTLLGNAILGNNIRINAFTAATNNTKSCIASTATTVTQLDIIGNRLCGNWSTASGFGTMLYAIEFPFNTVTKLVMKSNDMRFLGEGLAVKTNPTAKITGQTARIVQGFPFTDPNSSATPDWAGRGVVAARAAALSFLAATPTIVVFNTSSALVPALGLIDDDKEYALTTTADITAGEFHNFNSGLYLITCKVTVTDTSAAPNAVSLKLYSRDWGSAVGSEVEINVLDTQVVPAGARVTLTGSARIYRSHNGIEGQFLSVKVTAAGTADIFASAGSNTLSIQPIAI